LATERSFAAEADVPALPARNVTLAWHVEEAQHAADEGDYAEDDPSSQAEIF